MPESGRRLRGGASSVGTLLTRPKAMAPLFQYSSATGRFRQIFGDVALPDSETRK
jgi:hypothetical protein